MVNDANDILSIHTKETCVKEMWTNNLKDMGVKMSMQFLRRKPRITRWYIPMHTRISPWMHEPCVYV